jgi:hypothetical protein
VHRLVLAVLLTVVVGACGADRDAGASDSGIRGRAVAGPQCPVEVAGSPCPDLPFEGTVVATSAATGDRFTVETDADGRFELPLAPGTYEVSIDSPSPPPFAKPLTVTVRGGAFARVTVVVDTGIR